MVDNRTIFYPQILFFIAVFSVLYFIWPFNLLWVENSRYLFLRMPFIFIVGMLARRVMGMKPKAANKEELLLLVAVAIIIAVIGIWYGNISGAMKGIGAGATIAIVSYLLNRY